MCAASTFSTSDKVLVSGAASPEPDDGGHEIKTVDGSQPLATRPCSAQLPGHVRQCRIANNSLIASADESTADATHVCSAPSVSAVVAELRVEAVDATKLAAEASLLAQVMAETEAAGDGLVCAVDSEHSPPVTH